MRRVRIFETIEESRKRLPDKQPKKVVIGGKPFCFVRFGNKIRAFSDLCPHQRASLSDGKITGYNELVCPLHAYRFDLELGDESSMRCGNLLFLEVKSTEEGVFVLIE
jgi:nitrite reductase/ring-hydroxylating ferredoxin subunit